MDLMKIYRKIAAENGIGVNEVQDEMQAALNEAYQNPPDDNGTTKAYQKQVPSSGNVPTPDEFIRYAAEKIAEGYK